MGSTNYTEEFAKLIVSAETFVRSKAVDDVINLPTEMNIYFYGEYNFFNRTKLTINDLSTITPESLFRVADKLAQI